MRAQLELKRHQIHLGTRKKHPVLVLHEMPENWVSPPCHTLTTTLLSGGHSLACHCWQIVPWVSVAHQKISYKNYYPCDNAGNCWRGNQLVAFIQREGLMAGTRCNVSSVTCT